MTTISTQPIGWSVVPVDESSMPATKNSPPMTPNTTSDPSADRTGNQASVLSARSTAHERLAISQEVWNRLMPPVSTLAQPRCSQNALVNTSPLRTVIAPGRVNLMGDHTDYNDGFVLPLAVDRACTVRVTGPGANGAITAISHQLDGRVSVSVDGRAEPAAVEPAWGRFVAGVVRALIQRGIAVEPADLDVDTTVPVGSGLSSSSALAVALTVALGGDRLDRVEAARVASAAETAATGVPGGLMDQLASLFGQAGHALLIDCRATTVAPVADPAVDRGAGRALRGAPHPRGLRVRGSTGRV